jgi:hypothetical protein
LSIIASTAAVGGLALGIVRADSPAPLFATAPSIVVGHGAKPNATFAQSFGVADDTPAAVVRLRGLPTEMDMPAGPASSAALWRLTVDNMPKSLVAPPQDDRAVAVNVAPPRDLSSQDIVSRPVRSIRVQPTDAPSAQQASIQPQTDGAPSAHMAAQPSDAPGIREASIQPQATGAAPNRFAAPAVRQIDPTEAAALLKQAEALVSKGDLPAARLLLQRLAQARNARAAYDLATTYDPTVIEVLGVVGAEPDLALARNWYERARDWGGPSAPDEFNARANAAPIAAAD